MFNYGKIVVLLLAVLHRGFAETGCCDANLCDEDNKHISCGNNENFPYLCERPAIINITKNYQRLIVRNHNLLRNEIAKGFKKFPPAASMATMQWDDGLAKFAAFKVKQCQAHLYQCRLTPKFSFRGQNLAVKKWKGIHLTLSAAINSQMQEWFNEYRNCPLEVINSYELSNSAPCARFTVMIQDKSTHVGCAILRSASCGYARQIIVCNYAYDNMLGAPVYSEGETASQCTTGTNKAFPSLCSIQEEYY